MAKTKSLIIRITMILIILGLLVNIINMHVRMNRQNDDMLILQDQLSSLKLHNEQLTIWNNSPIDRDYIIRIAKEQGFRMPGEILFYNDLAQ